MLKSFDQQNYFANWKFSQVPENSVFGKNFLGAFFTRVLSVLDMKRRIWYLIRLLVGSMCAVPYRYFLPWSPKWKQPLNIAVVDPHHLDADPTYHCDADPDPDFYLMRIRIQLFTLIRIRIHMWILLFSADRDPAKVDNIRDFSVNFLILQNINFLTRNGLWLSGSAFLFDVDPYPYFYLMRIRIQLVTLKRIRIRIQVPKLMWIHEDPMRIRIHNTA